MAILVVVVQTVEEVRAFQAAKFTEDVLLTRRHQVASLQRRRVVDTEVEVFEARSTEGPQDQVCIRRIGIKGASVKNRGTTLIDRRRCHFRPEVGIRLEVTGADLEVNITDVTLSKDIGIEALAIQIEVFFVHIVRISFQRRLYISKLLAASI